MGVAEPLALLFSGLYAVLVLFYLWERWRRRVTIPSLLLWETVHEDTIRARRFRPDLLFVLQLLLLTCLILGLARPYFRGGGGAETSHRYVLVLDTSASMQAREGRGTRFDAARADALRVLQRAGAADEVMLVTAGHQADVAVNFTRDHAAVAKALQDAVPTDTGGDLALAVAFADNTRQRTDIPTELDVFTDIPRSRLPPPLRDTVTVFQSGESDVNLGIEALQVFQGRFQDYRGARAYVQVQNFAHHEAHGFLTVQLQDRVVHRNGFSIPARESKGYVVQDFPGPGLVVARLDAADALAADDTAYGWIRPVQALRVALVSRRTQLVDDLQELAAATPGLQLTVIDPETFAAGTAQPADVFIFHRFVPDVGLATNALYIYPPPGNRLFPVATEATNIEVLDWNAHHPALQSLRPLAALPLQRARVMTPPAWSDILLWSRTAEREFPLAFAGEHDGRRFACITFDLEAERLLSSDNVSVFLFFMNLLSWLAPDGGDARVVHTGDVQSFGNLSGEPLRVQDPRGNVYTVTGEPPTVEPLFAGAYRVGVDGTAQTLLANFFDPEESDIGRPSREPPIFPQSPASAAAPERNVPNPSSAGFGWWLYCGAAGLCLFEWLAARRAST